MLDFSVTLAITIVNIIVLTFILRAILFKPVTKFMADRARRVQDSIEQSESTKTRANVLLAQYEARLKTVEAEAEAIIKAAKEQAGAEADKIISECRKAAETELANSRKKLQQEHQAAIAKFREEAAALVVTATAQLLGREIKGEDSRLYAGKLLQEVSSHNKDEDKG
jgi:F-type H+-transporting ATPase subunit b